MKEKICINLKNLRHLCAKKKCNKEVELLINFGMKPEIRRKAFNNERKICVNLNNLRHLRANK